MQPIIYGLNDDPKYFAVTYSDNGDLARRAALAGQWKKFDRLDPATGQSYKLWYRTTSSSTQVMVDHFLPPDSPPGKYRIETFVPAQHATARKAIFAVAMNFRTFNNPPQHDEPIKVVDMLPLRDAWTSLGEYALDPSKNPLWGRVRQFDLSAETPASEVCFGPVRWVALFEVPDPPPAPGSGTRFDSPVGTPAERDTIFPTGRLYAGKYPIWDGQWLDINPFLTWYEQGCHTGADLNLPGTSDADKGKPIYAIADGMVTYAGAAGTWGNIIVIHHQGALVSAPYDQPRRQGVYSRYGHVDDKILVHKGQSVTRGQNIGFIGLPAGASSGWHLHFDVCYTDLLGTRPAHWPNLTNIQNLDASGISHDSDGYKRAQAAVVKEITSNYLDPLRFIKENHHG